MPPQWMWHCDAELKVWFDRVQDDRDEKYGKHDKDSSSTGVQNDYAKDRR